LGIVGIIIGGSVVGKQIVLRTYIFLQLIRGSPTLRTNHWLAFFLGRLINMCRGTGVPLYLLFGHTYAVISIEPRLAAPFIVAETRNQFGWDFGFWDGEEDEDEAAEGVGWLVAIRNLA